MQTQTKERGQEQNRLLDRGPFCSEVVESVPILMSNLMTKP